MTYACPLPRCPGRLTNGQPCPDPIGLHALNNDHYNAKVAHVIYGKYWQKIRRHFLADVAMKQDMPRASCEVCYAKGRTMVPATEVHHKQATADLHTKGIALAVIHDYSNLQALCHSCHMSIEQDIKKMKGHWIGKAENKRKR